MAWNRDTIWSLLRHADKQDVWSLIGANPDEERPHRDDADVIAVAYQLLAACEAVIEVLGAKCSYDHHGLCQEHHLRTDADGNPECEVKLLLDAIKKAKGTQHGSENI